jgi:hypothetical protein
MTRKGSRTPASARRRSLVRGLCHAVAVAAVLLASAPTAAQATADQAGATLERSVKAAFVFKFAAFVDWPAEALPRPDGPIRIGVMGEEEIAREIAQAAASRTVEGHPVLAKQVQPGDSLEGVHILFVRDAELHRLGGSVADLMPDAMLIVTESNGALDDGSVVNFVVDDGRVRFDISLDAAERRGLKLSSRLITVARNVRSRPR